MVIIAKTSKIASYFTRFKVQSPQIEQPPNEELWMVIVIPCYNEPDLIKSLDSIYKCKRPGFSVEVITVINASETDPINIKEQNHRTLKSALEWSRDNNDSSLAYNFILENNLPAKKAGVGLARKIGMDEAARRLPDNGIIVCFDADSSCKENYLIELGQFFGNNKKVNAASIYFEHPTSGTEFSQEIYEAIVQYELHLRYFIDCQREIELPYAYQTVGSAMAVRNITYQKVGGMNVRKAGEDFYFIHKCIKSGGFGICNSTAIYPSPRISDRVPFGTGKAIHDMLNRSTTTFYTYHPNSFKLINQLLDQIEKLYNGSYKVPKKLVSHFDAIHFEKKVEVLRKNTAGYASFKKQFYHVFDAFELMKCLHYLRDNQYPNIPVVEACKLINPSIPKNPKILLNWYRNKAKRI